MNIFTRTPIQGFNLRSWPWFLKTLFLPLGDRLFRHGMMSRLRYLEEAQWWDRERLHTYRERSLRSLIRTAYEEVPFYRRLMSIEGINDRDIVDLSDLANLPIVTKEMLRASYPYETTRDTGQKTYEACSSGSTGKNFCVLEDTETAGWYRASFMLALQWAGWQFGEPHVQTGMTLKRSPDRWLKDKLLRCHYVSAFDLTDAHLGQILNLIERRSVQHLWGYPGSLYYLAQRALEVGWNQPLGSLVTWGDNLYPHYRKTMEQAFRTRVFDTYGCGEGIQVSAQCGTEDTYHVHSLDVVVEYLDDDNQPVPPGTPGHVILTRLHPGPMPLIRYRVGDMAISGGARECACSRGFEIMESVEGRDTDVVLTPSGNRLIVHFFTGILEFFPAIDAFQVIQHEADSMTIRIVPRTPIDHVLRQTIISVLKDWGAADMAIEIELVEAIPTPPSGKRRFVIRKWHPSEATRI